MSTFSYIAKKGPAKIIKDTITAETADIAAGKLINLDLYPIEIKEIKEKGFFHKKKISSKDISIAFRAFADMLDAGMSVVEALNNLEKQSKNIRLKAILGTIKTNVIDGKSVSESMLLFPDVFDKTSSSIVNVGEKSGNISAVIREISDVKWMEYEVKSKVISVSFYPVFLVCFGAIVVFVLLTFAFPRITSIYSDLNQKLPFLTLMVMSVSEIFKKYWYFVIAGIIGFYQGIKYFFHRFYKKEGIDGIKLKIPLIGAVIQKMELRKFSRLFSIMLHNNVGISESLGYIEESLSNSVIRKDVEKAKEDIMSGQSVGQAFSSKASFPDVMVQAFQMGETGRNMASAMDRMTEMFNRDIDIALKNFSVIIEPTLILAVGAIIGLMVLAILLPVFNLNLSI